MFLEGDDFVVYNDLYLSGTPENIVVGCISLNWLDGTRLYLRTVTFFCGEINFHAVTYDPLTINAESMERARTRRFCFSGDDGTAQTTLAQIQQAIDTSPDELSSVLEAQHQPARQNSAPQTSIQACLVLDSVSQLRESMPLGPNVIFATQSIEHIIGVEAIDLQGSPFLSAVAAGDITAASGFLQNIATNNAIAFVTIRMAYGLLSGTSSGHQRLVQVEIMGAGYDDGAILLCQAVQQRRLGDTRLAAVNGDDHGYLSLEELLSTDAETSGVDSGWGDNQLS
ncbi:hypothetical protein FBU59_004490 [Linderina macrospora]|uniref:Uncharacterized protein n=1 Tax=Linderina macrospora TaxID=4868 RepID=A0ACC1J5L4_9FUNG|nr:hypothetical protein FBU59_004490 [Linderina macrospora]